MTSSSWPHEARSRHVTVDGQDLHYLELDGPPGAPTLVCVHGLGGSALNFGALGPLVSAHHRVLVLDLPGHGWSAAGAATRPGECVERLVHVVERFLEEAAEGPVVLVGHSLGGVISVLVAQRSPSVGRLVLLAPPVPRSSRLPWDVKLLAKLLLLRAPGVRRLVDRQLTRKSPAELVDKQLRDATPHLARVPQEAVGASVLEAEGRLSRPDAAAARRLQWNAILGTIALLGRSRDWAEQLTAVEQPTLWLQGHDDLLVPCADAAALAATRPDWTFRTRPGVGHLAHLEDAPWVSETLAEWLSGTAPAAPTAVGAAATLLEAAGGEEGLLRLARAWHERVVVDEVVGHAFRHGVHPHHTDRLAAYWVEALGGPPRFTGSYGDESTVVRMHSGNGEHEDMDDRAVRCFDQAMTDVGLSEADPVRAVLHDWFSWATKVHLARYPGSADDVPDGLRVPRWGWDGLVSPGAGDARPTYSA